MKTGKRIANARPGAAVPTIAALVLLLAAASPTQAKVKCSKGEPAPLPTCMVVERTGTENTVENRCSRKVFISADKLRPHLVGLTPGESTKWPTDQPPEIQCCPVFSSCSFEE